MNQKSQNTETIKELNSRKNIQKLNSNHSICKGKYRGSKINSKPHDSFIDVLVVMKSDVVLESIFLLFSAC